jgi:hypothetical protein
MERKRLFEPGEVVVTFRGEAGLVLSEEAFSTVKGHFKEGKRAGRFFAAGCCHRPDYVTQVPVLFENGTFDVMRSMNLKKMPEPTGEKKRNLEGLLHSVAPERKEE